MEEENFRGRTIICYRDGDRASSFIYMPDILQIPYQERIPVKVENNDVRSGEYVVTIKKKVYHPELFFNDAVKTTPCLYYLMERDNSSDK